MTQAHKTEFEERVPQQDFLGAVRRIKEQKAHASEYSGAAGQLTRNEIERHGLNRKAFGWHLQLEKLDAATRIEVLRNLLQYEFYAGSFDQIDAFDDLTTLTGRIADKRAEGASASAETAPEETAEAAPKARRRGAGSKALDSLTTH